MRATGEKKRFKKKAQLCLKIENDLLNRMPMFSFDLGQFIPFFSFCYFMIIGRKSGSCVIAIQA